ncbi:MAG: hypothetical protein HKN25_16630, partial [Pyrinomonadaceae bacterium]|nr:hypothetical protein [Pyrinomonadaceae bacterium]
MSTISLFYLLFLGIVAVGYYNLPNKFRPFWLLASSYLFYFTWQPAFLLILIFETVVAFGLGKVVNSLA